MRFLFLFDDAKRHRDGKGMKVDGNPLLHAEKSERIAELVGAEGKCAQERKVPRLPAVAIGAGKDLQLGAQGDDLPAFPLGSIKAVALPLDGRPRTTRPQGNGFLMGKPALSVSKTADTSAHFVEAIDGGAILGKNKMPWACSVGSLGRGDQIQLPIVNKNGVQPQITAKQIPFVGGKKDGMRVGGRLPFGVLAPPAMANHPPRRLEETAAEIIGAVGVLSVHGKMAGNRSAGGILNGAVGGQMVAKQTAFFLSAENCP